MLVAVHVHRLGVRASVEHVLEGLSKDNGGTVGILSPAEAGAYHSAFPIRAMPVAGDAALGFMEVVCPAVLEYAYELFVG